MLTPCWLHIDIISTSSLTFISTCDSLMGKQAMVNCRRKSLFDGCPGVPPVGSPSRKKALNKIYQAKSRKKKMAAEAPAPSSPASPSSRCPQEQVSKPGIQAASPAAATTQRVEMASLECKTNFGNAAATADAAMVGQECQKATRKPEMVSRECQTDLTGQFPGTINEELVREIYALRTRFKCNIPRHLLHKYWRYRWPVSEKGWARRKWWCSFKPIFAHISSHFSIIFLTCVYRYFIDWLDCN